MRRDHGVGSIPSTLPSRHSLDATLDEPSTSSMSLTTRAQPSAAASVAATPGAFASRVCADPDCADCAAEFACVACMEEDGEGPCEDEGGVLV